jgi:hypothetical protein
MQPCRGITWWGSFEPMGAAREKQVISRAALFQANGKENIGRKDPYALKNVCLLAQARCHNRLIHCSLTGGILRFPYTREYPIPLASHFPVSSPPKPERTLRQLPEIILRQSKENIVTRYT